MPSLIPSVKCREGKARKVYCTDCVNSDMFQFNCKASEKVPDDFDKASMLSNGREKVYESCYMIRRRVGDICPDYKKKWWKFWIK